MRSLVCMACLRIRWSLIHGIARILGWCPGDHPKNGHGRHAHRRET